MKILLIEDNSLTRHAIKALLVKLGHEVVAEAENGGKAVEYFIEFKPDVVFLDLILPGKSGIEVLEDLRNLDPLVHIVVITAVNQNEIDNRLYDKGVHAILRKPFSSDELKVLMKELAATNLETSRTLEGIAVAGMEKCMARLSRISAGKWKVAGVRVSQGSMDEIVRRHTITEVSGFAVYFRVTGECPFTAMIIFKPEDIGIIARSLPGFSQLPGLNQAQELLFSELGNIILNSVISALSNKLKRGFLPSAPECVQGEPRFLLETLWNTLDDGQRYSVAAITLDLQCDKDTTHSEVVIIIPESLSRALAAA